MTPRVALEREGEAESADEIEDGVEEADHEVEDSVQHWCISNKGVK